MWRSTLYPEVVPYSPVSPQQHTWSNSFTLRAARTSQPEGTVASLKHRSCQHRQPFPLFGPSLPKEPRPHPNMAKTQTLRKLPSGLNLIYLGRRLCHTHTTTGPSGDNTSASKEWTQSMKDRQSEPTHRTSTQAPQEQSLQQETGRHRPAPLPYLRRSASTCWL